MSVWEEHDEVIMKKKLPIVGQIVRSKIYNTFWRVMEKREIWQHTANSPQSGKGALLPTIYLAFWKIQKGVMPGVGKILGYTYTLFDNTFESNWEIVEETD